MEINPLDILIHIINIGVTFLMLKSFVYKPVKAFMDARTQKILAQTEAAQKLAREASDTLAACDAVKLEAETYAKEKLNAAVEEGNAQALQIINAAKEEAAQLLDHEKANAASVYNKKVAQAKDDIVDMSFSIAKKVLGREVTPEDNHALVERFFEQTNEAAS